MRWPLKRMHLDLRQHDKEGITVLDLKGKLILGEEDASLRTRVTSLIGGGRRQIVLNLHDLTHVDTAGVGTLIFCAEDARQAGGRLVIASLSPAHNSVANLLRLDTELGIFRDEQDAVNSFFPERVVPHFDVLELVREMGLPQSEPKAEEKK